LVWCGDIAHDGGVDRRFTGQRDQNIPDSIKIILAISRIFVDAGCGHSADNLAFFVFG
jgi:hypothetical protein